VHGLDVLHQADDLAGGVYENCIDGISHAKHVDGVARLKQKSFAALNLGAVQESTGARQEGISDARSTGKL
jgi:hypothetical protein